MDLFIRDDLKALLAEHGSPCISLFMPTHPGGAEADPIRWRKHLAEAEDRLVKAGWRTDPARAFLAPGRRLLADTTFWKNQSDGLAAFLSPSPASTEGKARGEGVLRLFRLPVAFQDRMEVANRFSITPLLPLLSADGRFFVLALSQHAVRLLHGTRRGINEVDLKNVPQNLDEASLGHEAMQPFTFFGRRQGQGAGSAAGVFHGHGVGIDDSKVELLHFFEKIDRGLHALLKEEKAPLILAAVEYLHPIYRKANSYAHLLEQGIEGNPERWSSQELHDRAWPLVQPLFEAQEQRAAAQYRQLAGTGRTSADLPEVVAAACTGKLETMFVPLGRQVWGTFDPATERVEQHKEESTGDVDLLELAAAHTLAHGRTVYVVEPARFPSATETAAIFCLPLAKHAK